MGNSEKGHSQIGRFFEEKWPTWVPYLPAVSFLLLGAYFVLMLPYYPQNRDLWPSLAGTAAACGLLFFFSQRPSREEPLWPYGFFLVGTIGFILTNVLAMLLAGNVQGLGVTDVLMLHIPGVLVAIAAGLGLRDSRYLSGFLAVVLVVSGIWYVYEALSLTWTAPYREHKLVLTRGYHTVLAMELALVFSLFAAYAALAKTRRYAVCALLVALVVGYLLLLTKTRTALAVTAFITLPTVALVQNRWGTFRQRLLAFLLLLLVLAPVGCMVWYSQAGTERRSMSNVLGRIQAWAVCLQIALERPPAETLIGNGRFERTFATTAERYDIDPHSFSGEELQHSHNVPLQTFLETGVLGTAALFMIWMAAAYRALLAWTSRGETVAGVMVVALLTLAVMGQIDYSLNGAWGLEGQLSWYIVGLAFASGGR